MKFHPLLVAAPFALWAACAALPSGATARAQDAPLPTIRAAFAGKFLIGTTLSGAQIRGDSPNVLALATANFDAFTAENDMKPDALQRVKGQFTFETADRLVDIARNSGALVAGHALLWHQQTPKWFFRDETGAPLPRDIALENLRAHITGVVGHFKGRVASWDVVNEALSDKEGEMLRPTPAFAAIGPDYIAQAFKAARAADPDATLVYNDYNLEMAYKRPKAVALLQSLLAQGAPIDAVGIQGHLRLSQNPDGTGIDIAEFEKSIEAFGALGLKVMITELDIGVLPAENQGADLDAREQLTPQSNPYVAGLPPEIAARQAKAYGELFAMFLRHADVIERVTFWGVTDSDSWLNNYPIRGRTDYALLFDRDLRPKPAVAAILGAAQAAARK